MTRQIIVGGIPMGGGAPVVIQSMLNTKTTDVEGSLKQLRQLASAGCQVARRLIQMIENNDCDDKNYSYVIKPVIYDGTSVREI